MRGKRARELRDVVKELKLSKNQYRRLKRDWVRIPWPERAREMKILLNEVASDS